MTAAGREVARCRFGLLLTLLGPLLGPAAPVRAAAQDLDLPAPVRDLELPEFANRLTPLVEVAYSSLASSPSNLGTQVVVAPGVVYGADSFQLGLEALIPAHRASGRFVGVITQLRLLLDDLFPGSLGKPLFGD